MSWHNLNNSEKNTGMQKMVKNQGKHLLSYLPIWYITTSHCTSKGLAGMILLKIRKSGIFQSSVYKFTDFELISSNSEPF
jgi:hypothetical protein